MRTLVTVLPDGEFAEAPAQTIADAVIRITPGQFIRVVAHEDAVWSEIETGGDVSFARTLIEIWRGADWDIEEDLSGVVGDVAAHRLAGAGRQVAAWGRYALRNMSQSVAEYWSEERPVVARGRDIGLFSAEVERLNSDVTRLAERIERIASRMGQHAANRGR